MKNRITALVTFRFFICFVAAIFSSCNRSGKYGQNNSKDIKLRRPPAAVEKAWLARHQYDPDRRLLIPKYSGARWGSILEYTENESLVYRDWWVRDVKMEELSAEPSTKLVPFYQIELGMEGEQLEPEQEEFIDIGTEEVGGELFVPQATNPESSPEDSTSDFPFAPMEDPSEAMEEIENEASNADPFAPLP